MTRPPRQALRRRSLRGISPAGTRRGARRVLRVAYSSTLSYSSSGPDIAASFASSRAARRARLRSAQPRRFASDGCPPPGVGGVGGRAVPEHRVRGPRRPAPLARQRRSSSSRKQPQLDDVLRRRGTSCTMMVPQTAHISRVEDREVDNADVDIVDHIAVNQAVDRLTSPPRG